MTATFKFKKGSEVKDVVTGVKGIIVYRIDFLTGCKQYGIQPTAKDNVAKDLIQVDENRLESTGDGITLPQDKKPAKASKELGGAQPLISQRRTK